MECQVVQCPTNVQTFHQELDLVESNLSSLSADWNDRIRSMIQVQGLLLGKCDTPAVLLLFCNIDDLILTLFWGGLPMRLCDYCGNHQPGNCFAVHSYQGNEVAWKSIVDGLVIQLSDLRSKVVRQACATVSTLAASLGSDFHSYVEMIVPPLILLTGKYCCLARIGTCCYCSSHFPLLLRPWKTHSSLFRNSVKHRRC